MWLLVTNRYTSSKACGNVSDVYSCTVHLYLCVYILYTCTTIKLVLCVFTSGGKKKKRKSTP